MSSQPLEVERSEGKSLTTPTVEPADGRVLDAVLTPGGAEARAVCMASVWAVQL